MASNDIRDIDKEIANAEKVKNLYIQRLEASAQLLQALRDQKLAAENEKKALAILEQPMPAASAVAVPRISLPFGGHGHNYGKPNTQLFEEILLEHGRPMHISSLLDAALARGLRFKGKRAPIVQMRSALTTCKRIYNVGGNTWWVIDQPMPEKPPVINGHGRSIGTPSASSVPLV